MSIELSKHVSVEALKKFEHIFVSEEVTNEIEREFNVVVREFDYEFRHDSGDINQELMSDVFESFMEANYAQEQ